MMTSKKATHLMLLKLPPKEVITVLTLLLSFSLGDENPPNAEAVNVDTDADDENAENEPMYVVMDEMKTFHRQMRIILEGGSNENCFTADVEPNQHLKIEYTVRNHPILIHFKTKHLI
jgi:hypothetical protein